MLTSEQWIKNIQKATDLTNQSTEKQIEFYRSILVVGVSILGILISLHTTQSSGLCSRLVFALSILLLLLGILLASVVLYDLSLLPEQVKKKFLEELHKVLSENRAPNLVTVGKRDRTLFCEKWSVILLLSALTSLVVYTLLSLFPIT